nr:Chain A, Pleurocidin [Pseudopleuronectes americanus]
GWGSFFRRAAHVGRHVGRAALTHYL